MPEAYHRAQAKGSAMLRVRKAQSRVVRQDRVEEGAIRSNSGLGVL